MLIRLCKSCSNQFEPRANNQKYCSKTCAREADKIMNYPGVVSGTAGAIGELLVSADLLAKGYSVFKSVSPHSPFDLVACKGKDLISVEVKTGRVRQGGSIEYHKGTNSQEPDYYAVVLPKENRVLFIPELV